MDSFYIQRYLECGGSGICIQVPVVLDDLLVENELPINVIPFQFGNVESTRNVLGSVSFEYHKRHYHSIQGSPVKTCFTVEIP